MGNYTMYDFSTSAVAADGVHCGREMYTSDNPIAFRMNRKK
jgi:hypothetical protein